MRKTNSVLLSTPYILWMLIFTLIPLGVVGYYPLTDPDTGALTLEKLAHLMATAPAAIIGRRAEIAAGAEADIAVFDLNEKFTVDPDQFVSKGKSSPFTGTELYGVTELTVCAGNIVYRRR